MMPRALFPSIRLVGFLEHRIRKPVQGALLEEHTDQMLTEPMGHQINRYLTARDSFVFSPKVGHVSAPLSNGGDMLIFISHIMMTLSKSELVQHIYGA